MGRSRFSKAGYSDMFGNFARVTTLAFFSSALFCGGVFAETVEVKYRGPVSLAPFLCEAITRSSFIERVCYDAKNAYMLMDLSGTWYHYCEIDQGTVSDLLAAESMGHFYNASIRGRFDCRTHRVPQY